MSTNEFHYNTVCEIFLLFVIEAFFSFFSQILQPEIIVYFLIPTIVVIWYWTCSEILEKLLTSSIVVCVGRWHNILMNVLHLWLLNKVRSRIHIHQCSLKRCKLWCNLMKDWLENCRVLHLPLLGTTSLSTAELIFLSFFTVIKIRREESLPNFGQFFTFLNRES